MNTYIIGYHTDRYRKGPLTLQALEPSEGFEQWLGPGFYFWEDERFAHWWGKTRKCIEFGVTRYMIYQSNLDFSGATVVDLVFNETDYQKYLQAIDLYVKHRPQKGNKPTIRDLNQFIHTNNIWKSVDVIRFEDSPPNEDFTHIQGLYYRKRIQLCVRNKQFIHTFAHHQTCNCV